MRALQVLLLGFVLVAAASTPNAAVADGELRVSVREVDTQDTANVQFLAKVVDQNGRPIPDLTPESFTLTVGDQTVPITAVQSVTDAQVGISSLLVIDTSGSMVGAPLAAARNAAAQYIRSLQPVDEVGVMAFANGISVISDFTGDFAAVEASLANLRAVGNTALYDSVAEASRMIAERENARKVVILLSDGEQIGPTGANREQALGAAAGSGVPFYVIGLGPSIDVPLLEELASSSDGAFFAAPSSAQLASFFEETANLLRSEYIITADFSASGLTGSTTGRFRAEAAPGNGEVSLTFNLPLPPAPEPTAVPVVEPVPVAEESGGGISPAVIFLGVMVLAAVAVGVWLFWRRRTQDEPEEPPFIPQPVYNLADEEPVEPRHAPTAVLRYSSGEELRVEGVATLGVDEGCTFRLPLSRGEFGHGELRIWYANNRYMIHDVAPRPRVRVNGRPVNWSFLGDGDEIDVRGVKLRFSMSPQVASVTGDG
jgi:VWFA-related protein